MRRAMTERCSDQCRTVFAGLLLLAVAGCAPTQPKDVQNLCNIFREKDDWYEAARESEERWGTPIHVQMAIIHQESTFRFDARPQRRWILGIIPWTRPTSAYGYAQVKDSTWEWYQEETGNGWADRDDFEDALDFVGWYTNVSNRSVGISKWDPYRQYLAYHEGHGGYKRGSYADKPRVKQWARRVASRAERYGAQLRACEEELQDDGFWLWPF